MKTRLFIEDQEVELNDSVSFALTKTFEDLHDPTKIINDWSKTVSIPFTNKNHAIFGGYFRADRMVIGGGNKNVGVYFDPTKKASFHLYVGPSLVMTGYAKLTSIKRDGNKGSYEVNLFGQLGDVLQKLQDVTPDDLYHDEFTMNRTLIYDSWTRADIDLYHTGELQPYEVLGWSCSTQGLYEDNFDSKTIELTAGGTKALEEVLKEAHGEESNIDTSALIGDGLSPRARGEYRSYYQIPFIYMPRFFQFMKRACLLYTGYRMELDSVWFNNQNPYYNDLVMMLQRLNLESNVKRANNYTLRLRERITLVDGRTYSLVNEYTQSPFTVSADYEELPMIQADQTILVPDGVVARASGQFILEIHNTATTAMRQDQGLVFTFIIENELGGLHAQQYLWCAPDTTINTSVYPNVVATADPSLGRLDGGTYKFDIVIPISHSRQGPGSMKFYYTYYWVNQDVAAYRGSGDSVIWNGTVGFDTYLSGNLTLTIDQTTRSGRTFVLSDVWGDKTPFEMLIRYCKMFGLLLQVDNHSKIIKITPRGEYFANSPGAVDWTDKLDISSGYSIKPLSFETKYISMDMASETDKGDDYKEKYDVGYGGIKVSQSYEFNNETTELFTDVTSPIISTDNMLGWITIYNQTFEWKNTDPMVYARNDNKPANVFGAFFFRNGLYSFDESQPVKISDDSPQQRTDNQYCYFQDTNVSYVTTEVPTYPGLDIIYRKDGEWTKRLATFTTPAERFDSTKTYNLCRGIYQRYWETYLNERYNIQTKIVECYLWLTPVDYANFDFNRIVVIDGVSYVVNKIVDYDPTTLKPTKCELVTIKDFNAYIGSLIKLYEVVNEGTTLRSYVDTDSVTTLSNISTLVLGYGEVSGETLSLPQIQEED